MSICKLIHDEKRKVSRLEVDLNILDPKDWDELIEILQKRVEKLTALASILKLQEEDIDKIEQLLLKKNVDISTSLLDIIVTRVDDISDTSVIYVGNLNFQEYEKTAEGVTQLPEKLKYIFGGLMVESANIESVDLHSVFGRSIIRNCPNLKIIKIEDTRAYATFGRCNNLESLALNNVGANLEFVRLPKLNLENIICIDNQKIHIGGKLSIPNSNLEHCTDRQLLEKFDIDTKNIIRN